MLAPGQADWAKKETECRYKEQQQLKSAVHRWRSGEGDSEETLPLGSSIGFSLGLTLIGEIGRELGPRARKLFEAVVRIPADTRRASTKCRPVN